LSYSWFQTRQTGRSMVQWYLPFSIPWLGKCSSLFDLTMGDGERRVLWKWLSGGPGEEQARPKAAAEPSGSFQVPETEAGAHRAARLEGVGPEGRERRAGQRGQAAERRHLQSQAGSAGSRQERLPDQPHGRDKFFGLKGKRVRRAALAHTVSSNTCFLNQQLALHAPPARKLELPPAAPGSGPPNGRQWSAACGVPSGLNSGNWLTKQPVDENSGRLKSQCINQETKSPNMTGRWSFTSVAAAIASTSESRYEISGENNRFKGPLTRAISKPGAFFILYFWTVSTTGCVCAFICHVIKRIVLIAKIVNAQRPDKLDV